jgi:Ca-activated chloride channel family protein
MKSHLLFAVLLAALPLAAFPGTARADGIIIPEPPPCFEPGRSEPFPFPCPPPPWPRPIVQLEIKYHHVEVSIRDQVATTRVDQVFFNPNDWQVEGTYIFPIPQDAAVSGFKLWVDGEPVDGRVMEAEEARRVYQDIVNNLRDPALLEYAGRGAVQANVFPIPPGGERRIQLEYSQVLSAENGLVRYVYPLSTEKFSLEPLQQVSVQVQIESQEPIRAVYSPSHPVEVSRESDGRATAGYEDSHVLPDSDFILYYSLGEVQAFHLLSYRDPGDREDPDGFFLMLLAPQPESALEQPLPKDVLLVLDRSGSMEGEKFRQAQEALRYILESLGEQDRFNVIAFSTGVESFATGLRPAGEAGEARAWVDRLSAQGSTDINRALLEAAAMADAERPTYLIFLTDGLPTQGEIESQRILDNFTQAARRNLRLFSFGVGYDVDTFLLDSLSQAQHGASTYVQPGEPLDEILSAFYTRISTPVLTDLELEVDGVSIYDLYPSPLPDLFAGSQIVVLGRYRDGGTANVTLSGRSGERLETFRYDEQIFKEESGGQDPLAALARLWATRKIGYLLSQVRLQGPDAELIQQIVNLSVRYGIVTPYTSYLVTEELPLGQGGRDDIAARQFSELQSAPSPAVSGAEAVQKAADQGGMSQAEAPAQAEPEVSNVVRIAGSRAFVLQGGVWIDTSYDQDRMQSRQVEFLSKEYFDLANANPGLAAAFALGSQVIAVSDGQAIQVVDGGAVNNQPAQQVTPYPYPVDTPGATPTAATEPYQPPQAATEAPRTEPAAGPAAPCASGLLPLLGLLLGFVLLRIRR